MQTMEDSSELMRSSNTQLLSVHDVSILATHVGSSMVHLQVPPELVAEAVVPGVARGARVDIVLMENHDALSEHLHLLGSSWLADKINTDSRFWLTNVIRDSVLMRSWCLEDMWLAVPLERKSKLEYSMPMVDPKTTLVPLLDCKTSIIVDHFSGIADSTLAHCSNSLSFLMGECKLGCGLCSKGLVSAATN